MQVTYGSILMTYFQNDLYSWFIKLQYTAPCDQICLQFQFSLLLNGYSSAVDKQFMCVPNHKYNSVLLLRFSFFSLKVLRCSINGPFLPGQGDSQQESPRLASETGHMHDSATFCDNYVEIKTACVEDILIDCMAQNYDKGKYWWIFGDLTKFSLPNISTSYRNICHLP